MADVKFKPPSEKTIRFLYNGVISFYPDTAKEVFGLGKVSLPYRETWGGFKRLDFLQFALNTTRTETIEDAATTVRTWREGRAPEATVPEKLDEMVASLEEEEEKAAAGGRTKPAYDKQKLAKDTLLESEKAKEALEAAPEKAAAPEPVPVAPESAPVAETAPSSPAIGVQITPQAGRVFQKFTNRVASLPVRTAVAWAAPTVAAEESPTAAVALTLWSRGIPAAKLEEKTSLLEAREAKRFAEMVRAIKGLETSYSLQTRILQRSFPVRDITLLMGPGTGVTQAQVALFFNPPEDGGLLAVPHRSFLGNLFSSAGQQLFGKLSSRGIKGLVSKAAAGAAGKAAGTAAGAEIGAAVGGPAAPVTSLVGAITGWLAQKIPDLISWLKTHAKEFGAAAVALLAGGAFFGNPFLLAGGLSLGALSLGTGGLGSLGAGAAGFGQGVLSGITGVVLPAVGVPILVSLLAIPVVIVIVLFIINSGAYLVPPRSELLTGGIVSPYIDVKKTATPDCLNRSGCPALPGQIAYKIEVKAKKGTLTNIKIDNVYQVFGKGSGAVTPPKIEVPASISPVATFVFSYTVPFGKNLDNSVVYDTLTVTADAPGQAGAVASAVASVIVGNPPASSCPIVGGAISTGSYNGSREVGHGSNSYWSGPAGTDCGYEIPAFSGCDGPTSSADSDANNVCRSAGTLCPYYGFAADVRRSGAGDVVQLPSILGQSITWKFGRRVTIAGGSWGYGYTFSGSAGGKTYSLYLGHINKVDPPSSLPSGTVLGTLYPGLTPPHVHIELQLNGQWVRPDFLCGGAGP